MIKLIGAALLAAAAIACGNKSDTGSNNSQPRPDSVTLSATGGTTFSLVNGQPVSPGNPPPTAVSSDSVVVIGGQQCVATVKELLPPSNPPKYRIVIKC